MLGLAIMAFGLLGIERSDKFMVLWTAGVGLAIFVNSLTFGIWMMSDRRLVLDKSSQKLISSWSVLNLRNSTTHPLSDFTTVRCAGEQRWRQGASNTHVEYWVYPVTLQATTPHRSRTIFEESDFTRARQFTREIGEFLGIRQECWEPATSESDDEKVTASNERQKARIAERKRRARRRDIMTIVGALLGLLGGIIIVSSIFYFDRNVDRLLYYLPVVILSSVALGGILGFCVEVLGQQQRGGTGGQ